MKRMLVTLAVTLIFVAALSLQIRANRSRLEPGVSKLGDCVQCGLQGDCRACIGGGDGQTCTTSDCATCTVSGFCGGGYAGFCAPGGSYTRESRTFRIDAELIRQIGAQNPRFAATLANQNVFGFHAGVYRVYWTPVEISPDDVEFFLNRKESTAFFDKWNDRARAMNSQIRKGAITEIRYSMTVSDGGPADHAITIELGNSELPEKEAPGTVLEIELRSAADATVARASRQAFDAKWSIR
jgi:hypothetical protein